jgi:hypothetical protein
MLIATVLGVFIIPGNFTFMQSLGSRRRVASSIAPEAAPAHSEGVGGGGA